MAAFFSNKVAVNEERRGGCVRCGWCGEDPQYVRYHDEEWGVPERDSRRLFAKLVLDGAQAGLSWITILRKRDAYYRCLAGLEPAALAAFSDADLELVLQDPGIVRNRQKVWSARKNALAYLDLEARSGSFSDYLWSFVDGRPIVNRWESLEQVPTTSREAMAMSEALKGAGFSFVGPTIVYAFMQAVGMVNDHLVNCFRHQELDGGGALNRASKRGA